ncbi:hypothetical protein TNCV_2903051 [Trichonephila clavipes]|nr:hypothetical protein TNCV_2903051 [Trichonephila clavipes]
MQFTEANLILQPSHHFRYDSSVSEHRLEPREPPLDKYSHQKTVGIILYSISMPSLTALDSPSIPLNTTGECSHLRSGPSRPIFRPQPSFSSRGRNSDLFHSVIRAVTRIRPRSCKDWKSAFSTRSLRGTYYSNKNSAATARFWDTTGKDGPVILKNAIQNSQITPKTLRNPRTLYRSHLNLPTNNNVQQTLQLAMHVFP